MSSLKRLRKPAEQLSGESFPGTAAGVPKPGTPVIYARRKEPPGLGFR